MGFAAVFSPGCSAFQVVPRWVRTVLLVFVLLQELSVVSFQSLQSIVVALTFLVFSVPGVQAADNGKAPVKVYILSGQSNMVGIGQVSGGGSRWDRQFQNPVVSVYAGEYSETANYDAMKAETTLKLEAFGGVQPTPYPKGGTAVVRGTLQVAEAGVYELRPGYGGSTYNIMHVDGKEVHRREPGQDSVFQQVRLSPDKPVSFRIVYLTHQADGLGWIARTDIPGTLSTVVREDGQFPELMDEQGNWKSRDDVWYRGVVTATANKWLSVGCGASANSIGPELGFGWLLGDYHEQPVLILKASQGNRSLGWDYLPPGSGQFEHESFVYAGYGDSPGRWEKGTTAEKIDWYAGKQYDDCFDGAAEVLKNFNSEFPHWADRGYEIAGFVWWQGHKDGGEPYASRYEQNLVHLIGSLREKFSAPQAPFAIATVGFGGWEMSGGHATVAAAQLAVSGEKNNYPQFRKNVITVETRDFWKTPEESPRNQDFHYNGNAETYMRVGQALGQGMIKLLSETAARQ